MTSSPGAPFKRLLCRSRSRLILVALAGLALYCLHEGPSNNAEYRPSILPLYHHHPQVASSQHRRAVLQRNNASLHPSNSAGGTEFKSNTSTPPSPNLPVMQSTSSTLPDDREVRAVLEVDIPKKSTRGPVAAEHSPEEEGAPIEDYDVEELEEELAKRRKRVHEVCEATGLDREVEPNAWEFFIDHKHHLVWCNIFKAASSTWMYNFNLLAGYKEDYLKRSRKTPLVLARSRFPRPSSAQLREALPSYLSFMIVRDPFERLLSAYRNKIEAFRHKFYRKLCKEIIHRYRKPGSPYQGLKGPSFSEFVTHVVDTSERPDEHWAPYYRFCTPCQVNFTVIAQVETLSRDQEYVIRHAGLAEELPLGRRGHREALNKARGAPTNELLERYFRQLSRDQLMALYRIYRIDFDMFGYDADKYFRMIKEPEPGIK
ncbi:carbohydrate sulfotransferase 11-like [Neocloeon triangulifer]|uniref:carbohydrate sulfotransferase 11-like n=1 Tax=Neocloeon triangulifer TaxID=2078957 RepID=UPI00286F418E|nr:carbohydrate sulfotransferase 11-like [Neocloeon triangulifer]